MAKYALIYKSDQAFDWSTLPLEEIQKIMTAWGAWSSSLGAAAKSGEAFKFGGKSVTKDGAVDADNLLGGFTVVEAGSMEEAEKFAAQAPNVLMGKGSMEIYEIVSLGE